MLSCTNKNYLFILSISLIFLLLLIRTAWLGDDAYISFRVVDNFVNGYGLNWNIDERVQVYTNPLWVLLLSTIYFFFQNIYYVAIVISIAFSLISVVYLFISTHSSVLQNSLLFGLLITSKAFVDYSTSGLENPLTNFLLITFVVLFLKTANFDAQKIILLSFIAALALVNRMDSALLLAPSLFLILYYHRTFKTLFLMAIGFIPFIAWEIFALIYYGFPFPNTAYVKLNSNVPFLDVLFSGGIYWLDSLITDPVTLITILIGIFMGLYLRNLKYLVFSLGILLFLIYVVKIGGDFMSGRFFVAPFIIAISLLILTPLPRKIYISFLLLVTVGFIWNHARFYFDVNYEYKVAEFMPKLTYNIHDERLLYFSKTGLLSSQNGMGNNSWLQYFQHEIKTLNEKRKISLAHAIGMYGFFSPREHYIIDGHGLAEPFLSRMPTQTIWNAGHFSYHFPQGYFQSRYTGMNHIKNIQIAKLYDKLNLITKADIWQTKRFMAILDANFSKNKVSTEKLMISFFPHLYTPTPPVTRLKAGKIVALEKKQKNTLTIQAIVPADENGLVRLVIKMKIGEFIDWELMHYEKNNNFVKLNLNFHFRSDVGVDAALQTLCIANYPTQHTQYYSEMSLLNNQNALCNQYLIVE